MQCINRTYPLNQRAIEHLVVILTVSVLLFPAAAYSASTVTEENISLLIESTDLKHQTFTNNFQTALLNQPQWYPPKYKDINPLSQSVKEHLNKNNNIIAANLIFNNIKMLDDYYDNIAIFDLIRVLLNQNDAKTANALFKLIKNEGDQTLISNTAYIFATFSFNRNKWEKTLQLLTGVLNDLPDENLNHALLMQGISLQRLNKHRQSILSYEKVKPSSEFYISARLNMAIANIRQGWWTDGHIIIQDTLKLPDTSNVLYMVVASLTFNVLFTTKWFPEKSSFASFVAIYWGVPSANSGNLTANRALSGATCI